MNDTMPRRPRLGPWMAMVMFVALWLSILALGPFLRAMLQPVLPAAVTPREIVGFRLLTGLPLSWIALAGTIVILRLRGQHLADIGWGRRATIWGWLSAAALSAFFIAGSFRTQGCRGICAIDPHLWLDDWSAFRVTTSVAVGLTAGICEEVCFRGFVMTEARDGGAPLWIQIVLAGLSFGLAHIGIASLSGHFDPAAAVGVVGSTTVFGMAMGVVYALGNRSLLPGIVGHCIFAFATEPWVLLWGLQHAR